MKCYRSPMTISIKAELFPRKVTRKGVTQLYISLCVCVFYFLIIIIIYIYLFSIAWVSYFAVYEFVFSEPEIILYYKCDVSMNSTYITVTAFT